MMPLRVIVPVMTTSFFTGIPVSKEKRDRKIAALELVSV